MNPAPARTLTAPPAEDLFDSAAELRGELRFLEACLQRETLLARAGRGPGGAYDEFAGLYVPEEEIDGYLGKLPEAEAPADLKALEAKAETLARDLQAGILRAEALGRPLRLSRLRAAFSLTPEEHGILMACLAPDLDMRFERYYAYLQNDVSRKRPCVQLLAKLFLDSADDHAAWRRLFASRESLAGHRLLEIAKGAEGPFAGREFRVAEEVIDFLLENDAASSPRGGRWRAGRPLPGKPSYYRAHGGILERLVPRFQAAAALAYVGGGEACGKEDLALGLAHALSRPLLEWEAGDFLARSEDGDAGLEELARDLRMRSGILWMRHAEAPSGEPQRARVRALGRILRARRLPALFTGGAGPGELRHLLGPWLEAEIAPPGPEAGVELWREALGSSAPAGLCEGLAAKFRFGPGKIVAAVEAAESDRDYNRECPGPGGEAALHRACRAESQSNLSAFAQKLVPKYRWPDLVLPADILAQLREIGDCVRYRTRVYGDWGFEHKFSLGKGFNVLFSGPSGTGKTMSAEVLAGDLGLDLYKIDLSSVVSKYIGETEKNLARIFREAGSANCILLFDEADALFGKRSEVKDSHDRYANIEINFLLQRMEEYEGMVILTTNMLKNLDGAFTRRIQHTVEFPVPDEKLRESLWNSVFPAATPRAGDLDLAFLSRRFKLSGANIKNIALNSAFLAAANGNVVDMDHVVSAVRREYRKLGKLASRSEFGPYYRDDGGEA